MTKTNLPALHSGEALRKRWKMLANSDAVSSSGASHVAVDADPVDGGSATPLVVFVGGSECSRSGGEDDLQTIDVPAEPNELLAHLFAGEDCVPPSPNFHAQMIPNVC